MSTTVVERIDAFLSDHGLLPTAHRGKLFVGFSGGADSAALLLALHQLRQPCIAVHFHHGLRPSAADRDRAWCEAFCSTRGIPLEAVSLAVPEHRHSREGLEAAARRCRLDAWRQRCTKTDVVALAHHRDDALETLLLRLLRGGNTSALIGLRADRTLAGVRFIRPLLGMRKSDLTEFLRENSVTDWCEDASNRDTTIRRNAVRHRLLPLVREIADGQAGLEHSLTRLAEDAETLETTARDADQTVQDSAEALADLPPALLARVVRRRCDASAPSQETAPALTAATHERLRAALATPAHEERRIPLGNARFLILTPNRRFKVANATELDLKLRERSWDWRNTPALSLPEVGCELRNEHCPPGTTETMPNADETGGVAECFNPEALPDSLYVRSRRPGDTMVPFGGSHHAKLQDLLVDAGIPKHRRDSVPVVEASGTIIWVPGVRRAEFARVRPDGRSVCLRIVAETKGDNGVAP